MGERRVEIHRPTGFSDPSERSEIGLLQGFVFGRHQDAGGYDRPQDTVLAVVLDDSGRFDAVPLRWLRDAPPLPDRSGQ